MSRSSALEQWLHERLEGARQGLARHDRFVLITVALALTPMPFPALLAVCLSVLQLRLIRMKRLGRDEGSLLRIALVASLVNLAGWFAVAGALLQSGVFGDILSFLRDAHLYPITRLFHLLGRDLGPPRWDLSFTFLVAVSFRPRWPSFRSQEAEAEDPVLGSPQCGAAVSSSSRAVTSKAHGAMIDQVPPPKPWGIDTGAPSTPPLRSWECLHAATCAHPTLQKRSKRCLPSEPEGLGRRRNEP